MTCLRAGGVRTRWIAWFVKDRDSLTNGKGPIWWAESICAENNDAFEKYFVNLREYRMPEAKKPEF
jgi:hypothetical protein